MIQKPLKLSYSMKLLLTSLAATLSGTLMCACMAFAAGQIEFQWEACQQPEVAGYRLFSRKAGESYDYSKPIWEGPTNFYAVTGLSEDAQYHFVVRAFDARGAESADSNEVEFRYDANPPTMPVPQGPADNETDLSVTPGATPNLAASAYSDPDAGQHHSTTHWQIFRQDDASPEDPCVFDLNSTFYLTRLYVPPSILENANKYYWTVTYGNQVGGTSPPAPLSYFTTETATEDSNQNGIPETQEADCGASADFAGQVDAKCVNTGFNSIQASVTSNDAAAASLTMVQAVDPITVTPAPVELSERDLPAGLINFKMKLAQPGTEAGVTISYSGDIPESDTWVMFTPAEGYREYPETAAISEDRRSINCQLKDGGDGDMDGIANGSISAMGGYGRAANLNTTITDSSSPAASSSSGGGGGGCFIGTLAN